jgi:hypothetical protein
MSQELLNLENNIQIELDEHVDKDFKLNESKIKFDNKIMEAIINHDNNDSSSDIDDGLDTSWIIDQERLQNIQSNYCREPMTSIDLFYIYINRNQYINKILCEKQSIIDLSGFISKELLLKLIQSKKIMTANSKYKLSEILSYHVDLEPEQIQSYSHSTETDNFNNYFKVLPILDDITITPSIFIFHDINALYFLFQEVDLDKPQHRHTLKSILKTSNHSTTRSPHESGSQNNTKKVRIIYENSVFRNPDSKKIRAKLRKTRRKRPV